MFFFEPVNQERDLFTVAAIHSICKFQDELISPKSSEIGMSDCPMDSIANTIAEISNKQCHEITQSDLDYTKNIIEKCGKYTYNNSTGTSEDIPNICTGFSLQNVNHILVNLAQIGFFDAKTERVTKLEYTAVYMRGRYYNEKQFFYDHFSGQTVGDKHVKISAVKFADHGFVKWDVLADFLLTDILYFGVALVLVFFIMFVYLRSIVLIFSMLLNIIVSFVTAYFLYFFVCRLTFFPYLNLLTGLVLIAVGADDMFIMYDCWDQAKSKDPDAPIQKILQKTLHHSALAVIVTSLTTSSAFFANALSNITAIKNFAIFAGISILANLYYMLTLIPSVIVCIEWFYRICMKSPKFQELDAKVNRITSKFHELSVVIFHYIFPVIVDKTWFLWIFFLLVQGLGACIVVFVYPKFKLPDTKSLQLFQASNVIENFDLTMRTKFASVVQVEVDTSERIQFYMYFGIHADDPRNQFDPDDHAENSSITLDKTFNIAQPDIQVFIYETCHELLKQPFMPDYIPLTCQLDAFLKLLKVFCVKPIFQVTGCCPETIAIPVDSNIFTRCAAAYHMLLLRAKLVTNNTMNFGNILGDFIFEPKEHNEVVAYRFYVPTTFVTTAANDKMGEYNTEVMNFMNDRLTQGPQGVQSGFVTYYGFFWFYDIQESLASGTFSSIGLSLSVAFVVMLITSQSLVITIYAMVTICFAISCTVAVLVFLGWYLNVFESLIISLSVGLSIDFTIHFGVAYRLSDATTSAERTKEGFQTVGAAVTMAALTTFVAGIAVMPAEILVYINLGIFLMLVMTFSWVYANFFFQSVCHIIGPSKQCYEPCNKLSKRCLTSCSKLCCHWKNQNQDKGIVMEAFQGISSEPQCSIVQETSKNCSIGSD